MLMFPPPSPWKQRAAVDPAREYVAFTSRFFLRSPLRVPAFLSRARRIMKQADDAPGIIGWSLGADLLRLEFHTLSAWEDAASLRRFVREGDHFASLQQFDRDMRRKTIFVYYTVVGRDLPLRWDDALVRQRQHDKAGRADHA